MLTQFLLTTKVGQAIAGSGWFFGLLALGYGLYTGKVSYDFFGPIVTAVLGAAGYHIANKNGNGNGKNGNGATV